MGDILSKCEELRKSSGGAFDPLLGRLSDLWGFGTGNERVPDKDEINSALNGTGSAIEINENGIKIPSGTVLDLGSVGKGIACDEVRGVLENSKIKRAVVSVGGSILLYGEGEKFTVGIRDPFSESSTESFAVLTLPATCVSTSGSYERYFDRDGVRYHHILENGLSRRERTCQRDGRLQRRLYVRRAFDCVLRARLREIAAAA